MKCSANGRLRSKDAVEKRTAATEAAAVRSKAGWYQDGRLEPEEVFQFLVPALRINHPSSAIIGEIKAQVFVIYHRCIFHTAHDDGTQRELLLIQGELIEGVIFGKGVKGSIHGIRERLAGDVIAGPAFGASLFGISEEAVEGS